MNTTQKRLRNTVLVIGTLIIGFFAIQAILSYTKTVPPFEYVNYQTQLEVYKDSDKNFEENSKKVKEYVDEIEVTTTINEENTSIYDILPEKTSETSFVSSNDDQVRDMAKAAVEVAQDFYGIDDVKFVTSVYAVEERLAVYTETPRSYLFFALTPDESKMVGIVVTPTPSGYDIETLWTVEQASDTSYVETETNRLLFIFSNQVFE